MRHIVCNLTCYLCRCVSHKHFALLIYLLEALADTSQRAMIVACVPCAEQSLLYAEKSDFKLPHPREYWGIKKLRPQLHYPFNYIQLNGIKCL